MKGDDMKWYDIIWYEMIWYDMISYDRPNDVEAFAFQTIRSSWLDLDRYLPSTSRVLSDYGRRSGKANAPLCANLWKYVSFGDIYVPL